jgi:uncharacterized protein (TIGR02466 family)
MNFLPLFSSPLLIDFLEIDNDKLKKHCYKKEQQSKGRIITNFGGWQSEDIKDDIDFFELTNEIEEKCLPILNEIMGINSEFVSKISDIWININRQNHLNHQHFHAYSFFSLVYYVKAEKGCGNIVFYNTNKLLDYAFAKGENSFFRPNDVLQNFNVNNSQIWKVEPQEKMVVIFPSWMEHSVDENKSGEDRISMALNTKIARK